MAITEGKCDTCLSNDQAFLDTTPEEQFARRLAEKRNLVIDLFLKGVASWALSVAVAQMMSSSSSDAEGFTIAGGIIAILFLGILGIQYAFFALEYALSGCLDKGRIRESNIRTVILGTALFLISGVGLSGIFVLGGRELLNQAGVL